MLISPSTLTFPTTTTLSPPPPPPSPLSLSHLHQLHAQTLKSPTPLSLTHLLHSYSLLSPLSLTLLLSTLPLPLPTFPLNSLLRSHASPLLLFPFLPSPDRFSLTFALKSATRLPSAGLQLHAHALKRGLAHDPHVRNKLVHFYAVSGNVVDARKVFDGCTERDVVTWNGLLEAYVRTGDEGGVWEVFEEMPERDVVSWNIVMGFYVGGGRYEEALGVFRRMQEVGLGSDRIALIGVLTAVARMGALALGMWVHAYVWRRGVEVDENLNSALINMYSKCGCVEGAEFVFREGGRRRVDDWNAMMCGYTGNGWSRKALELFEEMEETSNIRPNVISYSCVLSACSHGGFVEEGVQHFSRMKEVYGIEPDINHYGCLTDLFGRAGLFEKVEETICSMPMGPDPVLWKGVLGACRVHGNFELGERAGLKLIELAPHDHAGYVLLSNLYAANNKWNSVYKVRKMMKRRGIKKIPGCSSIETEGVVHEFIAGDTSHSRKQEIYKMLDEMGERLKRAGYEPDTKQVILDIAEDEAKESSLFHHSEKIAVAFGFISTKLGTTIRVVKNLRVCGDCHNAIKLLSRIYGRDIIVRDSNRFHHFHNGSCSCMDYW